jgi:hypothetical protein
MNLRLLIVNIIAMFVSLSAIGAAYAQDKGKGGNEGITQLYNAARKEGRVVIWGADGRDCLSTDAGGAG